MNDLFHNQSGDAQMLRRGLTLVAMCSLLLLGACRSVPVMNVVDAPVGTARSAQQVEQAIVSAGNSLGWRMQPLGPGKLQGTLNLRDHRAVVDIEYTAKVYSIKYKESSPSLNYDGKSIHNNYNGWIENLDRAIRNRLMS
jgi:hypothetical protein